MQTKLCPRCNAVKALTDFPRNKSRKDGYGAYCKVCAYQAKTNTITKDRATYLENKHRYYESHKEQYADYKDEYEHQNADAIREWRKQYRQQNKERDSIYRKIYRAANKLRHRIHEHNRRSKKRQSGGTFSPSDVEAQYKRQRGKCYWCGKSVKDDYHIDHVIPLDKGGANDSSNIVIACVQCNLSKANKLPHEWESPIRRLL